MMTNKQKHKEAIAVAFQCSASKHRDCLIEALRYGYADLLTPSELGWAQRVIDEGRSADLATDMAGGIATKYNATKAQLREVSAVLSTEIGGTLKETTLETAQRAVSEILALRGEVSGLRSTFDTWQSREPKEGTFEWAMMQMREGRQARCKRFHAHRYWEIKDGELCNNDGPIEVHEPGFASFFLSEWELFEPQPATCPICKEPTQMKMAAGGTYLGPMTWFECSCKYKGPEKHSRSEAIEAHNERAAKIRAIMEAE
jgi:hypothetical protein